MSRKRKAKRPVSNYLKSAIENNSIVPSLKKYKRRKTLSRWEKGAITRAEKKIRRHGGKDKLFALSKRQQKALKDKGAIVGNGIKAVSLNNVSDDATIRIQKGELKVKSGGRYWEYKTGEPDLATLLAQAEREFKKGAKAVYTWTKSGRSKRSFPSFKAMLANFPNDFNKYDDLGEFFLGLAVMK